MFTTEDGIIVKIEETRPRIPQRPCSFLWMMLRRYPWRVTLVYSCVILAFTCEGVFPYVVKKFLDDICTLNGNAHPNWIWGFGLVGIYCFYAFWFRMSGYIGLKLIILTKTEIYRLFNHYLLAIPLSDEAGKIAKSISLIGEGAEALMQKVFWHGPEFIISVLIHLGLMLSTHHYIFSVFSGWLLLHIVSNVFLVRWRKKYTLCYQQHTCDFHGRFVSFVGQCIDASGRQKAWASYDTRQLDKALMKRAFSQLIDWKISETIHLIYNIIHSLFMVLTLLLVMVLWQDKLISIGDIAMSVGIIISSQKMLRNVSSFMNSLIEAYSQIEAGLRYLSAKQFKSLNA